MVKEKNILYAGICILLYILLMYWMNFLLKNDYIQFNLVKKKEKEKEPFFNNNNNNNNKNKYNIIKIKIR